jgi:hypothetical protein
VSHRHDDPTRPAGASPPTRSAAAATGGSPHNVALAFAFNGIGIPAAATGLIYPVWARIAMAASVTTIYGNCIAARPALLFAAIGSIGRHPTPTNEPGREPHIP